MIKSMAQNMAGGQGVSQAIGNIYNFVPADIPQWEADALIAFYNATGGDSWTNNTNWTTDSTVGNWHGVTVSGGVVTAISLPSNNLSGDVGTTLDDFSDLYGYVDLSGNASLTNIPLWTYNVAKFDLDADLVDDVTGNAMSITRAGDLVYLGADDLYHTAGTDEAAIGKYGIFTDGAGTQYFVNPDNPVTQTINLASTGNYTLWVSGTGSAAIAANTATITGAGTATDGSPVTIEVTATGTVDVTITDPLDWCQLEDGTFASSRIYNDGTPGDGSTASRATQAADAGGNGLSIPFSSLHPDVLKILDGAKPEGTMICEVRCEFPEDLGSLVLGHITARNSRFSILYSANDDNFNSYDGTNTCNDSDGWDRNKISYLAVRWDANASSLELLRKKEDESSWTTDSESYDGAFQTGTQLRLFYDCEYPIWLRNLRFYNKTLTEAEIEQELSL